MGEIGLGVASMATRITLKSPIDRMEFRRDNLKQEKDSSSSGFTSAASSSEISFAAASDEIRSSSFVRGAKTVGRSAA